MLDRFIILVGIVALSAALPVGGFTGNIPPCIKVNPGVCPLNLTESYHVGVPAIICTGSAEDGSGHSEPAVLVPARGSDENVRSEPLPPQTAGRHGIQEASDRLALSSDNRAVPHVVSTTPSSNAQNAAVSASVLITFDTDMKESTLEDNSIVINAGMTGRHGGPVSYDVPTRTATLDPNDDFVPGECIQVTLTTDIKSEDGYPLEQSYIWTFTVAAGAGSAEFTLTETHPVAERPCWVTGGDLDDDGDIDLLIASDETDTVTVLLNDGTGAFEVDSSYGAATYPQSVVTADLNADGILDLATANGNSDDISIMEGKTGGTFEPEASHSAGSTPWTIIAADLNGDGYPDLANTNYFSFDVSVLLSDGNGFFGFGASTEYPVTDWGYPIGLCAADVDKDADIDLAVAEWGGNVTILLNDGNGSFSSGGSITLGQYPVSASAGDFDHDTHLDLAIARFVADSVVILTNDGAGGFSIDQALISDSHTVYACNADLNGDGHLDIASSGSRIALEDSLAVHLNDGAGNFPTKQRYLAGDSPYCIFAADFDGDGDLDVATANYDSYDVSILRNGPSYTTGDADGSGGIDIDDGVYLIAYIFSGGPPPEPLLSGDCDCSGEVDIDDVVYLINYIFSGGPPPGDPDGNGVPDC